MTFTWPWMLLTLLLVPLWLLLYAQTQRRRQQRIAKLGTMGLLQDNWGKPLGWQRHLPTGFLMLGLALLLFALARPPNAT